MSDYPQDGRGMMNNSSMNGASGIVGFVLGAIVGAGVALLLAPATGADTRRRLGQTANRLGSQMKDGVDQAKEHVDGLVDDAKEQLGGLKDDVRTAVTTGREAFARERDSRTEPATQSQR